VGSHGDYGDVGQYTVSVQKDATPPTSSLAALPGVSPPTFTLSWSGSDDAGGSGIASYDVFVSDNGGAYRPLLTGTTQTSTVFTGVNGHAYGFYSIATDWAGNRQQAPASAQASTRIVTDPTLPGAAFPDPAPGVAHPVDASLRMVRAGKKKKLGAHVTYGDGLAPRDIVSPFQRPRFKAVAAALIDVDGDGVMDGVLFTARLGKKKVHRVVLL
jgi:hypothetical protein